MPFTVQCRGCGRKFRASDKLAGHRMKCPKCSGLIDVPPADDPLGAFLEQQTSASSTRPEADDALGAFLEQQISPSFPRPESPTTEALRSRQPSQRDRKSEGAQILGCLATFVVIVLGISLLRWSTRGTVKQRETPEQWVQSVIHMLPQDGAYSAPTGSGGSYRDPIHGFFEVQPPEGFQIRERRDKTEFTGEPGFPLAGQTLRRSYIQFRGLNVEIGVIVRKSETSIEEDFEFVVRGYREKLGDAAIRRTRYVTVDGVKGGELVALADGMGVLMLKYKKHGLDHAITMGYDIGQFRKPEEDFVRFIRSYRSLKQE